MSETPFHRTQVGKLLLERTLPNLVRELARLTDAVQQVASTISQKEADSESE